MFYDAAHGRWIAIGTSSDCFSGGGASGHGYLDFAISDSANPLRGWTIYYYTYNDMGVADVGFGSSADKIVLTARIGALPGCGSSGSGAWTAASDQLDRTDERDVR